MKYDYIIVDTKLVAFNTFHRHQHILRTLTSITRSLKFNNIDYTNTRVVFAGDIDKSLYRQTLWKDYKGHRKEVAERANKSEQVRRVEFIKSYNKLHVITPYIGVNGILKDIEADDMVAIIRHLRPDANVLMYSLDLDWALNVDDKTHLLFFANNTLYTNKEQVGEKIEIAPELYIHQAAIGSQSKDNILNLQQFGKSRFLKNLVDDNGNIKENYGEIIDELLEQGKYGMKVNPKAKFKDWRSNYHLNLQLMNSIPISEVNIDELKELDKRLDASLPDITYEEFMVKCYETLGDIPEVAFDEFEKLRN